MIKNKFNKGDLLVYADEYGNQKAISPDNILIKVGTVKIDEKGNEYVADTKLVKLGLVLSKYNDLINELNKELVDLKEEYYNFKSKQLRNTDDLLENQALHNKKIESLSNDVKALLSINK